MDTLRFMVTVRRAGSESTAYFPAEQAGLTVVYDNPAAAHGGSAKAAGGRPGFSQECLVKITNTADTDFFGVIRFEWGKTCKEPGFFIPGFMYNRNTGDLPNSGRKKFPRVRYDTDGRCPESKDWMVRSDRPAAPVSLIYDSGEVFGISGTPYYVKEPAGKLPGDTRKGLPGEKFYQYSGFTCTWENAQMDGCTTAGYTLGYENAPWFFLETATVFDRAPVTEKNSFRLSVGESVDVPLVLYAYKAEHVLGIYYALEDVYDRFHAGPRELPGMTVKKAVALLSGAVARAAWIPEDHMYTGFVFDRADGYEYNKIHSLSWTNGLAVATPMLMSALRLKDEKMRTQALECIAYITGNCMNPDSGLPYDAAQDGVWSIRGWWYDGMHTPGHSSYLCGQALYYILKAYEYEKKLAGVEHPEYLAFVRPVIDKVNTTLNADCEYPFSMSEKTGAGLEYNSFGSVWLLTATAYYIRLTKDETYLELARKCENHYYETYAVKAECYGGPLDTDKAVDSEGNLAYMRALRYLHMVTGDEIYLEHLRDAICFECSFKLCYNTPVQVPPLSTIGWSSCGGTITSTANPHIHPMSSAVTDEMKYYLEHVDDEYVRCRLKDTLDWGKQTFNSYDGEYGYGEIGWMSERFCFSQGLLTEKYPDGSPASTWFALMPWASASILEGFAGECYSEQ